MKSLTPILARFSESELLLLHRLVHQECDEGVLSEKKMRNVYADIFPVVSNIFLPQQFVFSLISITLKDLLLLCKVSTGWHIFILLN